MGNSKIVIFCLTLAVTMLTGSAVLAQMIFEADETAEGSPLDSMPDGEPNDSADGDGDGDGDGDAPLFNEEKTADEQEKDSDGGDGGGSAKIGGPLLLTRHTMQFGGTIAIIPEVLIAENGDTDGGGNFVLQPWLGYFVIDNLEIMLGFGLTLPFGVFEGNDVNVGFEVGARYIFDFDVVCLYAGGMFGSSFDIPDDPNASITEWLHIGIPVGILLPFNRHVALNAGMRFQFNIHVGEHPPGASSIQFPIGYFGIEGFFNFWED